MDEQAITRAAEEAVSALQLDCKVKEVCRSPGGDQWCVQFSGKYGQFCDDLKNQFGEENSSRVVQEKIKSHLLKQVTKIRSSTGKSRRPRTALSDEGKTQSSTIGAPFQMIEDVLGRASQIAGEVVQRAVGVADAARETVAQVAENIGPVTVEIRSDSRVSRKKPRRPSAPKKVAKATSKKTTKPARSVSRPSRKLAKKAGKTRASAGGKAKKAAAKTSQKRAKQGGKVKKQ